MHFYRFYQYCASLICFVANNFSYKFFDAFISYDCHYLANLDFKTVFILATFTLRSHIL